ncbi:hypothetical protein [Chryseolinea sp. H1M3-3]|uniref:hypothetical protein n=1 Tax=Chryseolinea sp. H1M3-3 TaxID=3034144 RepID=UPI0023EB6B43|nr:hypothetical protein [Chryseolinea sp. H1M3-3]
MLYWLFGVDSKEHKALLASIMADTDESFFTWAIETVPLWNNTTTLNQVIRIHGNRDRVLSFRAADFTIKGGGHLMIVTRAKEISDIIKKVLA